MFSSCLTVDLVCIELNLIRFDCILVLTVFNNNQMEYTLHCITIADFPAKLLSYRLV